MTKLQLLTFHFFFNDTATTEIYTLSLHDALPISGIVGQLGGAQRQPGALVAGSAEGQRGGVREDVGGRGPGHAELAPGAEVGRSEEHTSELQSQSNLVCRLLLEKKKIRYRIQISL